MIFYGGSIMKKSLTLTLVLAFGLLLFSPAFVYAKEAVQVTQADKDKLDKALEELELVRDEAEAAGQDEIVKEIDRLRFNPETIYDLDTIGTRIELLIKISEVIRFATTELSSKVSACHTKVAGLVGIGLVKVANPFESVSSLEAYIEKLDFAKDELITYPDLQPEDIATIYVLTGLDEVLHKGRMLPADRGPEGAYYKSNEVKAKLRKTIHEITLKRLQPQITVMQANELVLAAEMAIEEAQSAPDVRASNKEVGKLVQELREARKFSFEIEDMAARSAYDKLIAEITFKVRLKIGVTSQECEDAIKVIEIARNEAAQGNIVGDLEEMLDKI